MTSYQSFYKQPQNERKTYPTKCSYCGEKVFYHTNGNGDTVFFNELILPWEKHTCSANYSKNGKDGLHREGGDRELDPIEERIKNSIENNKHIKKWIIHKPKKLGRSARRNASRRKRRALENQS